MENYYKIIIENGAQYLTFKGEKLPMQITSTITQNTEQSINGLCEATITVSAMLIDTKEIK